MVFAVLLGVGAVGWFFLGLFVGAIIMAAVFQDAVTTAEDTLESHKKEYQYSYSDISKAWNEGREGKPPRPPRPYYEI